MLAAFQQTGAILEGHFQLNSGRHSDRYLEKFNLLQWPEFTEVVCKRMAEGSRATNPQTIAGPTTGGIILAYEVGRQLGLRGIFAERADGGRAFQRDFHLEPGERVLVVDRDITALEQHARHQPADDGTADQRASPLEVVPWRSGYFRSSCACEGCPTLSHRAGREGGGGAAITQ